MATKVMNKADDKTKKVLDGKTKKAKPEKRVRRSTEDVCDAKFKVIVRRIEALAAKMPGRYQYVSDSGRASDLANFQGTIIDRIKV